MNVSIDSDRHMDHDDSMITTVTTKNMVSIPAEVWRKLGIKPGTKLDWTAVEGSNEIHVRVLPSRGELAEQLLGSWRKWMPEVDAVAELIKERELDDALERESP